jgi:antitoxin VapB
MAVQIANPHVVGKIERLARRLALSKTAAVEKAVDKLLAESGVDTPKVGRSFEALLAQFDRIPDRPDAFDPLSWDEHGLPK